jgi:hypothetical protein
MDGFGILVGHLVGDFIFQDDVMARDKKRDSLVCLWHAVWYCVAIAAFTQWPVWAVALTGVCHFAQDRTQVVTWWMDFNGQQEFRTGVCGPWSVIVVDNTWHLVQLFLTACLIDLVSGRGF